MAAYYKNYGNTARAAETAPAGKPRTSVKNKNRRTVMFVYRNDHKHKLSVLTVITLALIFAGAAGAAAAFANTSVAEHQIVSLNNELRDKHLLIKNQKEETNRSADAGSILEAARGRLGMSEPKPYQIIHINVPEENYVEYSQPTE